MMKNRGNWWALGLSAVIIYFLFYGPSQRKEISWQEFRTKYLDRGEVFTCSLCDCCLLLCVCLFHFMFL